MGMIWAPLYRAGPGLPRAAARCACWLRFMQVDKAHARSRLLAEAARRIGIDGFKESARPRSEEHTSELQSLMRISYAVFCLKKKNRTELKTHMRLKQSLLEHIQQKNKLYQYTIASIMQHLVHYL